MTDYSKIVPRIKTLTRDPRDTSCCPHSWEDAALLITLDGHDLLGAGLVWRRQAADGRMP